MRGNAEPAEVRHQADRMVFLRSTALAGSTAGVPEAPMTTMSGLAATILMTCPVTLVSRGA